MATGKSTLWRDRIALVTLSLVLVEACGTSTPVTLDAEFADLGADIFVCPEGLINCGGACVDPASDSTHCGACDNKCDTANGFVCVDRLCACVGDSTNCDGICIDPNTDPKNCGDCGTVCMNGSCTAGVCTGLCGYGGFIFCDGICVDPATDPNNCGSCGSECDITSGETCLNFQCS